MVTTIGSGFGHDQFNSEKQNVEEFASDESCLSDGATGFEGSSSIDAETDCSTANGILEGHIVKVVRNTNNCAGLEKMSAEVFSIRRTALKP